MERYFSGAEASVAPPSPGTFRRHDNAKGSRRHHKGTAPLGMLAIALPIEAALCLN
jgi:hypothetical protein